MDKRNTAEDEERRGVGFESMMAEEHERRKLAWELQQKIALDLSLLKAMSLALAETPFPEVYHLRCDLRRIGDHLDQCLENVQDLATNLESPDLSERALSREVVDLCKKSERQNGFRVKLRTFGLDRFKPAGDQQLAVALYRFLQEALMNVSLHAAATTVEVRLIATGSSVILSVADNGRGFETGGAAEPAIGRQRFGLKRMGERVAEIRGQLRIYSSLGQGTRVEVELPWQES